MAIDEDSATALSGASTGASLDLDSTGAITDDGTATLTIGALADFAGTSITVNDAGHTFGTLTFNSAGAVEIAEADGMDIVGVNTGASAKNLDSGGALSDAGATSTTITGLGDFAGTSITLGTAGAGAPTFNTGTLTFNSAGAVAIDEDSGMDIVGVNTAGSADLDSTAAISDAGATSITIGALGDFAGTSIALGGGTFNTGTLTFNSAGAVAIDEDSGMDIVGVNTAGSADLDSTAAISDAGATSTTIAGLGDFAGTSIALGGGTFNTGTLTFNSAGAVVIAEDSSMDIVGVNTAGSADQDSTAAISDAGATSITIGALGDFAGTSIALGGGTFNTGTLTFNSAGAVVIAEDSSMDIVGVNTAGSADQDSTAAISDAGATSITIGALGDFAGVTGVALGGGTFNTGTLTFNSAGAVVIAEDSATVLAGVSTGASLDLDSTAGISDDGTADLTIGALADFAGTSIAVDDNTHNFGTLTFNSAGAVALTEASATVLAGSNTAATLTLTGAGITDTGNVIVTGVTTLAAGANAITLDSATNDFQDVLNATNSAGNITIHDANDLTIGTATVGGNLVLNIDQGGNNTSTLDLSGATLTIGGTASAFDGQGTDDTLLAPNTANTWVFTGVNSGTFNLGGEAGTFSDFANITGGSNTDSFNFTTGSISSNIDGGSGVVNDTLSYAGGPAATIVLTAVGTNDGFRGRATSISGTFDNIDTLVGSANTDSIKGINANATWNVDNSTFTSTNVLTFSALENLFGGTNDDTFNIVADHSGNITDLLGGNDTINFKVGTLTGDTNLGSGNNIYDFNGGTHTGNVRVVGNDVWNHVNGVPLGGVVRGEGNLTIPNAVTPSDLVIGAGGLILPTLTGFTGHLIIGGSIDTPDLPLDGNKIVNVNTGLLTVNSNVTTGSNITLMGQNVDLDANIIAGGLGAAAGGKQLVIIAAGDGSGDAATGNITGVQIPTNIKAGNIIWITATNVQQPELIEIELDGGDAVVVIADGQEAPQFALFDANAAEADTDLSNFLLLNINVAEFGTVSFSGIGTLNIGQQNLAGNLIGLEQLAFIDVGLFEEDLSLFGVIGSGVALALAQCEEVEGCAPDVTESELEELITALHARIDELEKRLLEAEGADREKIEELLAGYRQELENFEGYKQQLEEYYSGDDDFDDELGEDEAAPPTVGDQIKNLGDVLEIAQRRINWLESLKADAEARAKLTETTGIELTSEAIDAIIEATRQEMNYIERQIQMLKEGTQAMATPLFWAESGDYNNIYNVEYGSSLLNIGIDSLAYNENWY